MDLHDAQQAGALTLRTILLIHTNTRKQVLLRGAKNILSTEIQLIDEITKFRGKECKFLKLVKSYKNPSMTTQNRFQAIEKKFNLLHTKEECFSAELLKALEKRKCVDNLLNLALEKGYSETASLMEITAMLENSDDVVKDVSDLTTRYEGLEVAWENMKGDLNADLDDCIQRVQQLIEKVNEN